MDKQVIIAVSREYGSGGHEIAEKLSKRFGLPFYDRNLLDEIATEKKTDGDSLRQYDEVPRKFLLSRTVRGYSNSPEEIIAQMQFDFLKGKADKGESFVVVGRCAEDILKGSPALIPLFILADMDTRIKRIEAVRNMTAEEAKAAIYRHDKKRKSYHNYHCQTKWGDARNYDLCMNSGRLGIDKTADYLEAYIREKMQSTSLEQ